MLAGGVHSTSSTTSRSGPTRHRSPIGVDDRAGPVPPAKQVQPGRDRRRTRREPPPATTSPANSATSRVRPEPLGPSTARTLTGAPSTRAATPRRASQLVLAADERRVVAKWRRKGGEVARPDQRRVLLEDPLLEARAARGPARVRTRHRARRARVGTRQGVVLAARRIQRRASAAPTPVRVPAARRPPAPSRRRPSARRPFRAAPRRDPPGRQAAAPRAACGRRPRSRRSPELHQRRSTPQRECCLEQFARGGEVAEAKLGGAVGGEPLEPSDSVLAGSMFNR